MGSTMSKGVSFRNRIQQCT